MLTTKTTLYAGAIYEQTKLPLQKWFLAGYLISQNKDKFSALNLSRHLCLSCNTAWSIKHKLLQMMQERENALLGKVKNLARHLSYDSEKYISGYLPEFEYHFNRRFDLASMLARLIHNYSLTQTMPRRLLKVVEICW